MDIRHYPRSHVKAPERYGERGDEHEVFYRVAHAPGAIYVDLGCKDHLVVAITAEGWEVSSRAEISPGFRLGLG